MDLEDPGKGATSRRDLSRTRAVEALVRGATYAEAGLEASVSARTIARWMCEPEFARSVSDGRTEMLNVVGGRLANVAPDAVTVLTEIMMSESPSDRLRAAQQILTWSSRTRRDGDVEQRLLEVEARLGLRPPAESADPDADVVQ
jgi:hypothetical protein